MGIKNFKLGYNLTTFSISVVLFDGDCSLCNRVIRFLEMNNKTRNIRFIPINSYMGKRFRESLPPFALTADSIVVLLNGRSYIQSTAIIMLAKYLKFPWNMISIVRILPLSIRDLLYTLIARNRYIFNEKKTNCRFSEYARTSQQA